MNQAVFQSPHVERFTPAASGANPDATLLIVDDMPENLLVLGGLLRAAGYRVKAARSGEAALRYAAQTPHPDLILLDVMMPDMDGYAVLDHLRAERATCDIPVIFVTALDGAQDEERCLAAGGADYIAKPIKPAVVLARVQTQLQAKLVRDLLRDKNDFLEAEVARRMKENLLIQDVSIHALAHLAETRDPETGNHIRRTQAYVYQLADEMRLNPRHASVLSEHFVQLLTKSAPLHDIGKVGIPDAILQKPGRLTPDEFAVMKTHARLGAEAIEHAEQESESMVEFLVLAKEIAHWHHERWDGSGYPDGLAGAAIPLSARLMAVADVFDALTSPRIYKSPMPFEQAVELIEQGAGGQFDPEVVAAFHARLGAFRTILERHAERGG
ncbi:MAG: two-component system response regulator [Betaproteobacteria bacterium]|nr:two-component system response regulator [Betaproteobacteria bacterium]